jgi:hypothetical protein
MMIMTMVMAMAMMIKIRFLEHCAYLPVRLGAF